MIAAIFASLWGRIASIGAVALAGLGAFAAVRRSGVQAQQAADLKEQVDDDAKANAARATVDRSAGTGHASSELHEDWERG